MPPSVASLALFVDRVKDPVIRTITLSAGKSADAVVSVDTCAVADGYVGWIVLGTNDGKPITERCIHVTLAGANRMRLRGCVPLPLMHTAHVVFATLPVSFS